MTRREFDGLAAAAGERIRSTPTEIRIGGEWVVLACRLRDVARGRCVVYAFRPLICRLMGHLPWMPCPTGEVRRPLPSALAVRLMRSYGGAGRLASIVAWLGESEGS